MATPKPAFAKWLGTASNLRVVILADCGYTDGAGYLLQVALHGYFLSCFNNAAHQ